MTVKEKHRFGILKQFLNEEVYKIENECERKGLESCEEFVKKHSYGTAALYWDKLKVSDPIAHGNIVRRVSKALTVAMKLEESLAEDGIDCNEQTIMNQDLALALGDQVNLYATIIGHAALEIAGTDLVLDTYDRKIRTIDDFIHKRGYKRDSHEVEAENDQKKYYNTSRQRLREGIYGTMEANKEKQQTKP